MPKPVPQAGSGGFVRGMTQPPVSLSQHLLTRSDLAKLGIPAGRILTWLGNGWLDQVGALPGHGTQGDPVFAVLTRELRHELANRLLELGKDTVVFSPLRVRSLLMRSLLLQQHGTTPPAKTAAPATAEPPEADPVIEALLDPDVADALRSTAHDLEREVETVLELAREEARLEAIEQAAEAAANSEGDPMEDGFRAADDDDAANESHDVDFFDVDDLADELGVWTEDPPRAAPPVEEPAEDQPAVNEVDADVSPSPAEPLQSPIVEPTQDAVATDVAAQDVPEEATLDDVASEIVEPVLEQAGAQEGADEEPIAEQPVPDNEVVVDVSPSLAEPLQSAIAEQTQDAVATDVGAQGAPEEATLDDVASEIVEPVLEQAVAQEGAGEETIAEQPVPDNEVVADVSPSPAEPLESAIAADIEGPSEHNIEPTLAGVAPAEGFVSHAEQAELEPTMAAATDEVQGTSASAEAAEISPPQSPEANALEDMLSAPMQPAEADSEFAATPAAAFEEAAPAPEVPTESPTLAPSATSTTIEPVRQEPTGVVTSDAAMQRVESFLGELRGVLVELATRPPAPPIDVQPLVAAVQQGFTQARDQSQATDTALASLTNRIGDFGEKVEHGVALAVHAALGSKSTAVPGPVMSAPAAFVVPRQDRTTVALFAIGFLVLCWTVIFWFKTGSPRLALGTLIGANVVGCCLLVGRRSN
ncbi:MAG: hypothetical protein IT456_02645 [Planctomycetes bacterium]|nr:hypothetical protein [Planctomycetota bacterium]